ncbi:DUF4249 family protein [Aquimarina sp. W85]|uniref:DUF4249 family protein n=1 Tax=Aquimarina rhodophyticola TaxID=3342246 RepID=UPI0036735A45
MIISIKTIMAFIKKRSMPQIALKVSILLIGIVCITGCEDVVDIDTPVGTPTLVVDASFRVYTDEEPVQVDNAIKLSLSAPFFAQDVPAVSNATVYITDQTDQTRILYTESQVPGTFIPNQQDQFIPQFNRSYELTVIYNDETYIATANLIPTVPIDEIKQGDGNFIDGEETEIFAVFTDVKDREDYYFFDFGFNEYTVNEDRFYDGQTFEYPFYYDDLKPNQELNISILGIDEQYFNYAEILIDQSDPGGGPFPTPPVNLRGNIKNANKTDLRALGYFHIAQAYRLSYTVVTP